MEEILGLATVIGATVLGLVEVVKLTMANKQGWEHLLPLVALFLGVAVGAVAYPFSGDMDMVTRLWAGGIAGLMATGAYEGITGLIQGKDDKQ